VIDSILAVISTLGWVLIVGVLLGLFGRTEGGAWSIAGSVARGVRDWSTSRIPARPGTSSPGSTAASAASSPKEEPVSSPAAELDDLGGRPIIRR
jgi:hypothetical protein